MKAGYGPTRGLFVLPRALFAGCLVLLATALHAGDAGADTPVWTSLGPSGGAVLALVADPNDSQVLYAGTLVAGTFKSTDGGLHWQRITTDIPYDVGGEGYSRVYSIAVDPAHSDHVFLSTPAGLYASTDGGLHVTALPRPSVSGGTFDVLLTNAARPGELFAANSAFNGTVYRSLNDGQTWTAYAQGLFGSVQALAVDGGGLCAASSTGFYRRGPAGDWARTGDLPGGTVLDLSAGVGGMYLSTSLGCFTSTDGGAHWDPLALPEIGSVFHVGRDGAGQAYLMARGRLVRVSADGVPSEVNDTDYPFTSCHGFVTVGTALVVATDMGIYRSDDDGASWRPSHAGLVSTDILPVAADPNDPDYFYVGSGGLSDSGIYLTTDGGLTWSQRGQRMLSTDVRALAVDPRDRNTLLAGTGDSLKVQGHNGGIWKSTDAGLTWRDVTIGDFPDTTRLVLDIQYNPDDPNIVYACVVGVLHGFYKSTDGGETWTRKSVGLESMPTTPGQVNRYLDYFGCYSMAIDPKDSQHLYIGQGGCWGAINETFDGGEHWIRHSKDRGTPGMPAGSGLEVYKLVFDPEDSRIVYAAGRSQPPVGIYKTTDGGQSWVGLEPRVTGYFMTEGLVMDPRDNQRLYAATADGIWTSANGGGHWTAMNEGLPKIAERGRSVHIHPLRPERLLYGSGLSGLFSRPIGAGTPVELVRFAATPGARGGLTLEWRTTNEIDHAGFHVYRAPRDAEGAPAARTRVTDRLITAAGPDYSYFDARVTPGDWDYYLAEISRSGATDWHGPLRVSVASAPPPPAIPLSAAPNPFARETVLSFTLAVEGRARLQVFDPGGRLVSTLVDGLLEAGAHTVPWDGRASDGARAAAGVYYARLTTGDGSGWTRKLTLGR